jgi:hypothetical protein
MKAYEMGGACNTNGNDVKCVHFSKGGRTKTTWQISCKWEDNIKADLEQGGRDYEKWILLAQDRDT